MTYAQHPARQALDAAHQFNVAVLGAQTIASKSQTHCNNLDDHTTLIEMAKKMSVIHTPTDGYQVVTPFTAQQWLASWNYEHQRPIRAYHVNNLAQEIINGRFREKTQINFCKLGDSFFLTNGQHTLSAIVKAQQSVLLSVVVLDVQSKEQIADDFTRHDTHLTRQLAVSLVAHEINKKLEVTATELNWITAAVNYYAWMIGASSLKSNTQMTNDVKLSQVLQYGELARSALRTYHEPNAKRRDYMVKRTTLACAMHVYNWNPDVCIAFYGEISKDNGLLIGDPRKTLLDYMRETRSYYTDGRLSGKKAVPYHYFVKAHAIAFNAFINRRQLKIIRVNPEATEAIFEGPGSVRC